MNLNRKEEPYSIADLRQFENQVVQQIFECDIWCQKRFKQTSLDFSDAIKSLLFLRIFTKIVTYDYPQYQNKINEILSEIVSEHYFSELIGLLSKVDVASLSSVDEEWTTTLDTLVKLIHQLLVKIPTSALSSLGLCTFLDSFIPSLIIACNDENTRNCLESIHNGVRTLRGGISEKLIKPELDKRREKRDERKPPNDFRKIPILPTREDIFYEPFLRKNLRSGSYENLDHYLDVQFRLLREDCIAQLRSGIYEFIEAKTVLGHREVRRLQDAKLYKNVTVISKESSLDGPLYELQLDSHQVSHIRWEKSKRLLYGSLLCLSPDDFDTLYFAVIEKADHDKIKQDGKITVSMRREKGQSEIPFASPMTMVESSAYFEAYRHVLKSLQTMTEDDTPFKRYIVRGNKVLSTPEYFERHEDIKFDLGPIINQRRIFQQNPYREEKCNVCLLSDDEWPSSTALHVDDSQLQALKFALTNEFVIIQGPPGTGKTHIGLQIAKTLLHNRQYWTRDTNTNEVLPLLRGRYAKNDNVSYAMLIVCYTNHALDQFMEGIVNFLDPRNETTWKEMLVRVGSRCANSRIESFSLKEKRRSMPRLHGKLRDYHQRLEEKHIKISEIKWILTQSLQNVLDDNVLNQWVEEIEIMKSSQKSQQNFDILKWLELDEQSLFKKTYSDYEKYEVENPTKYNGKTKEEIQDEIDKIIVDTEAALINAERHVEDDEFEVDTKFEEIGHNIDSIAESIFKQKNLDDTFEKLLKEHANRAKLQILSKDVMKKEEVIKIIRSPWKMPLKQRWRLYRYFVEKFRDKEKLLLEKKEKQFIELREAYLKEKQRVDREILMHSNIIAMTTSGAARYQDVLKEVRPRVIIVEEAAEVLEAHIVATLNSNCEHLILIGDHKQLEPKPAVFELAEKYNLSLSMFERMINIGLPYVCLERQHRMRPEISQLVRPVYEKLVDNENVLDYEDVLGIDKNLYFITHNKEESQKDESQSYWNNHEASYIQCLSRYILLQGYKTSQITILTPYSGQMFLLREMMPRREFDGIKISILDNYQGEENDIILLSLVRSNKEGKIGFLNRENRVCVALSRAKIGLYVIGNFENIQKFSRKCKLWGKVIRTVRLTGAFGEGLPLVCRIHSTRVKAMSSVDFDQCPEGGCSLRCDIRRQCGHACPLFCHPRDPDHKEIECKKQCLKRCELDHTCSKQCHFPDDCMCNVKVEKTLPCQHKKVISCCTDPETITCKEKVIKTLPCSHIGEMCCYEDPENFKCKQVVERNLECGHSKEFPCYFDYMRYQCEVVVRKNLPCGHEADMQCWSSVTRYRCKELVHRVLKCSHEIDLPCHVDFERYQCMENVVKKLTCGHECELLCNTNLNSVKCKERITEKRTISVTSKQKQSRYYSTIKLFLELLSRKPTYNCDHVYTRYCHESAREYQIRNLCAEMITKTLQCGHETEVACHLRDESIACKVSVMTEFECHHDNVSIPCHMKAGTKCRAKCGNLCPQKHECEKICHFPESCVCKVKVRKQKLCGHISYVECCTDVTLIPCEELVKKTLVCGHVKMLACKIDVNETDIPCLTKVVKELKCNHRLDLPCNVDPDDPSIKCTEKVEKTISPCGHRSVMSCFENPEKVECHREVNFVRSECGHETKIFCYLKTKFKDSFIEHFELPNCETQVPITLPCGHVSEVPCYNQKTDSVDCLKACKSVLLCGHICSGRCSECKSKQRHKECQEICNKTLVCGHKCRKTRCGACNSCCEICTFACSHDNCQHPCNKECRKCTKQCDWICQHFKCSKQCFEICDRPKCNVRCLKRLKCGHQCIGLCGDPCPNLCKKCDRGRLMKISKDKSHLFVELNECGHIFNSIILDNYMEKTEEKFSLKRCPHCSKVIKWHPRYRVELQHQRREMNSIRKTIQTVSNKIKVSAFPMLLGSGDSSLDFFEKKISTFLSANEKSLKRVNMYDATNSLLESLELLRKACRGIQTNYSIYSKLIKLSILWKFFIVVEYNCLPAPEKLKLREKMLEKTGDAHDSNNSDESSGSGDEFVVGFIDDELSEPSGAHSHAPCDYIEFERNLDSIKNECLKMLDNDTVSELDAEEKLKYFIPFLTDIGKGWMETANKFPKMITVLDVHSNLWKRCSYGHLYTCTNVHDNCLICYGIDSLSSPDFRKQQTRHNDYEHQGARPTVRQNQSVEDNQRGYQQENQNQRGRWNADHYQRNGMSGKYENNRGRGRGTRNDQPFSTNSEVAYVHSQSNFFQRFGRRREFQQDVQHGTASQGFQAENMEVRYPIRDTYQFQHRYQTSIRGSRHFENESGTQLRGRGGRGRGSQRGGRRGGRRGLR